MAWRKLGRIFETPGDSPWARSHATYPTADLRTPDRLRIYYTALNDEKFGQGGYVDVTADDPRRVLEVARSPVIGLGR